MSAFDPQLNITPDSRLARSLAWEPKHVKPPTVLYLVHCLGRIKIGITSNLRNRMMSIQTGCPFRVTLLASFTPDDPRADERMIHRMLEAHWIRGEWFHPPKSVITSTVELIASFPTSAVTASGRRFLKR